MERQRRGVLWVAASCVLVTAAGGATWWLIGDQTTSTSPNPDYLVRAPDIAPAPEFATGFGLTLIVLAYWVVFVVTTRRARTTGTWLPVVVSLTLAGVFIGYVARILTAGVIGANIGGGLALLAGPFILFALLGFAVIRSWLLTREANDALQCPPLPVSADQAS